MTYEDLLVQLHALGTEPTRNTYRRHTLGDNVLGVSFAHLGQLKKALTGRGQNKAQAHALALQLWQHGAYEARVLATMLADPTQLSPTDADAWAADLTNHGVADALAGLLAATAFARTSAEAWLEAPGEYQQRLGYALLGRLALQAPTTPDAAFAPYVARIEQLIHTAPNRAREGMHGALLAIGSRSAGLRELVEAAADRIGPVTIDHGNTACQTPAIRPYLAKVWARKPVQP